MLRRHGDFINIEHTVLNGWIIKNKSATGIIDELDDIDWSMQKDTGRFRWRRLKARYELRVTLITIRDNNGETDEWLD